MSASLPSLLSETASAARRPAHARTARPAAEETDPFATHLQDEPVRRAQPRVARPADSTNPKAAKPERPAKAERPEHPADPRSTGAQARASDRARERASDHAAFKRAECHGSDERPVTDNASGVDESASATTIADHSATDAAADAVLTIESALANEVEPSTEAAAIAAQNDSALAAAAGLVQTIITPVSDEQSEPQDAAAPAGAAAVASTASPNTDLSAETTAPVSASTGLSAGADEDAGGEEKPGPSATPASAQPGQPHPSHLRHANAAEPSPRAAPHQDGLNPADGVTGFKPQDHHGHGLHLQLQPVSDFSPAAPLQPAQPVKVPDAIPVQSVPIAIGLKALEGAREFEIRLDPAELGRVDVKLSISEDGRVQASLVVDRVETLALLQRDARTLERAFDQAGLTADANAIQFSLRQDGEGQKNSRESFDERGAASHQTIAADPIQPQDRPAQLYRGFVRETAVDIRV